MKHKRILQILSEHKKLNYTIKKDHIKPNPHFHKLLFQFSKL